MDTARFQYLLGCCFAALRHSSKESSPSAPLPDAARAGRSLGLPVLSSARARSDRLRLLVGGDAIPVVGLDAEEVLQAAARGESDGAILTRTLLDVVSLFGFSGALLPRSQPVCASAEMLRPSGMAKVAVKPIGAGTVVALVLGDKGTGERPDVQSGSKSTSGVNWPDLLHVAEKTIGREDPETQVVDIAALGLAGRMIRPTLNLHAGSMSALGLCLPDSSTAAAATSCN